MLDAAAGALGSPLVFDCGVAVPGCHRQATTTTTTTTTGALRGCFCAARSLHRHFPVTTVQTTHHCGSIRPQGKKSTFRQESSIFSMKHSLFSFNIRVLGLSKTPSCSVYGNTVLTALRLSIGGNGTENTLQDSMRCAPQSPHSPNFHAQNHLEEGCFIKRRCVRHIPPFLGVIRVRYPKVWYRTSNPLKRHHLRRKIDHPMNFLFLTSLAPRTRVPLFGGSGAVGGCLEAIKTSLRTLGVVCGFLSCTWTL